MKNKTTFKQVTGFDGYSVSKNGQVRNDETGKLLAISDNGEGRLYVTIEGKRQYVHRVVHNEFVYPVPKDADVAFINGNKSDLRADNLRIVSRSVSSSLAAKQNNFKGISISSREKPRIVKLYKKGATQASLADTYGVSTRTIRRIVNGR